MYEHGVNLFRPVRTRPCLRSRVRFAREDSVARGARITFAQVAKMPGPHEALGKDQGSSGHDRHADRRRGMSKVVSGAHQNYKGNVAKPAERNEGFNQVSSPITKKC